VRGHVQSIFVQRRKGIAPGDPTARVHVYSMFADSAGRVWVSTALPIWLYTITFDNETPTRAR
jgi:hypothetical protein